MDKYVYYVVYTFTNLDGTGTGSFEFTCDRPFNCIDDVYNMATDVRARNNFKNITVTNWKLLSGPSSMPQEVEI